MSSIYEKIDNRLETFLSTLKRFPLASFSAFLFTVIMLVLMDYKNHRKTLFINIMEKMLLRALFLIFTSGKIITVA